MTPRPQGVGARLAGRAVGGLMRRDLRAGLRRAVWAGPDLADPAPGRPVVLYANHHVFLDSYLLWWLITHVLGRSFTVWMEAWDRAPLFGPIGALPFPADDAAGRVRTIRETARRMAADPGTTLVLYPEGAMGLADDGLAPFRADLPRLGRLLPGAAVWWPIGVHLSGWGESRPTAVLAPGVPHDAPDGTERQRLADALDAARAARPAHLADGRARVLFEGSAGPNERWNLSPLAPLFRRWTPGA